MHEKFSWNFFRREKYSSLYCIILSSGEKSIICIIRREK